MRCFPEISAAEDDTEAAGIEAIYASKIAGARNLLRSERPLGLRAARLWRLTALAALREKRARRSADRFMLWRLQMPRPG